MLAACQTTPTAPPAPGTVTRIPPGNSERDGPEANPPPNLDAVPDAVPKIEPIRVGGPNKPYEIGGHTYVPMTDDRAVVETGLASWYGKRFHGSRTASGEAYNMYAMTAAHKTLPIPSYARVRNPANGHEVIVRVNDRGPFSPGRVIDLSYTAALKLGVLGGVQPVEITRITADDIRSGAAFAHGGASAPGAGTAVASAGVGDLDRPATAAPAPAEKRGGGLFFWRRKPAPPVAGASGADTGVVTVASGPPTVLPPMAGDVVAAPVAGPGGVPAPADAARGAAGSGTGVAPGVDLGAAAAADVAPAAAGSSVVTTVTAQPTSGASAAATSSGAASGVPADVVLAPVPPGSSAPAPGTASVPAPASSYTLPRDERGRAETTAGAGWYVQLGAYRNRNGALDFQHQVNDSQPWLAPLLAVVTDHGLNKLQAGPYRTRADAKAAADRIHAALQLVPTIVEKR